jgi:hypothetical protein
MEQQIRVWQDWPANGFDDISSELGEEISKFLNVRICCL